MKTHICLWGRRVNLRADWGCPLGPAQSCAGKATRAQDAILPHERNLGSVFNRADVAPAGTLDQFIFPCRLRGGIPSGSTTNGASVLVGPRMTPVHRMSRSLTITDVRRRLWHAHLFTPERYSATNWRRLASQRKDLPTLSTSRR